MVFDSHDAGPRRMSRARQVVTQLAALLFLAPLAALTAQGTGRIVGTVTDSASGRPISDAQVTIGGSRAGATTDNQGRYSIVNVPSGPRIIDVRRLGYQPAMARTVTVTDGATVTADFKLREAALSRLSLREPKVRASEAAYRIPAFAAE